jgi:hypothetical protein
MYKIALFLHLLGVALLVGAVTTTVLATLRAQTAPTVQELRVVTAVVKKIDVVIGPAMLLILGAAVYMVSQHGDDGSIRWSSGWVDVAFVIFLAMAILGPTIESGHAKRVLAAAAAEPDGAVSPALDTLRRAATPLYVTCFGVSQILAFLFLMTTKPALLGAVVTCLAAAVLSVAVATRRLRSLPSQARITIPAQHQATAAAGTVGATEGAGS